MTASHRARCSGRWLLPAGVLSPPMPRTAPPREQGGAWAGGPASLCLHAVGETSSPLLRSAARLAYSERQPILLLRGQQPDSSPPPVLPPLFFFLSLPLFFPGTGRLSPLGYQRRPWGERRIPLPGHPPATALSLSSFLLKPWPLARSPPWPSAWLHGLAAQAPPSSPWASCLLGKPLSLCHFVQRGPPLCGEVASGSVAAECSIHCHNTWPQSRCAFCRCL